MNGRPVGKRFRRLSAYVSQEDVFVPTMSAWETLTFHAALRLGNSLSKEEKVDRMSDVLRIMGLWRSRDTQVCSDLISQNLVGSLCATKQIRFCFSVWGCLDKQSACT
jgi:ABC-type multidrug transport system ATPase subunit